MTKVPGRRAVENGLVWGGSRAGREGKKMFERDKDKNKLRIYFIYRFILNAASSAHVSKTHF